MIFKNKVFNLLIALLLVFGVYSVAGAHSEGYYGNNNQMNEYNDNWNYGGRGYQGMMGYGGMMGMMMGNGMMGYNGMMGGYGPGTNGTIDYSLSVLGLTEDQVKELAAELVQRRFGSDYQISDIFIFSNSPYYISVEEKDGEQGAFELLFDPIRKIIYPEYGPNMMWNTKYGMSYMMGWGLPATGNILNRQQALENAEKFAQENGFTVEDEGHQFYGYYTFHTEENGQTAGMMSVNAYTGQVWYHNWHGNLVEVIEVDDHLE
jgi:sucrose-6-phosphate hydrolase SacC (GH32 family)